MDRRTVNTAPGLAAMNPSTTPSLMLDRYWKSIVAVTKALREAQTTKADNEKSRTLPFTRPTSRGPWRHNRPPCEMACAAW